MRISLFIHRQTGIQHTISLAQLFKAAYVDKFNPTADMPQREERRRDNLLSVWLIHPGVRVCFHRGNTPKLWPGCNEGFAVMAPLAVPHHFLLVPRCNNCFLHDFMEIKGRKVCFICKAGSSCRDVWILSLPPSLPLTSLPPYFSSPGSGLGRLWSLAEGRYGLISVVLLWEFCSAIINHVREDRGQLL